ncbi:OmpA family protein [Dechloromonas sp. TW-R-39-2]|jgi:peptidoglycan-associated lipoprotein|nr:OmpA family protein [Dechloromonas sp. TW-R-39-2]
MDFSYPRPHPVRQDAKRLSFDILHADHIMMRATLPATLLLTALLAGCVSTKDVPPSKHISQTGALRVHPGLLGQPVPPELQDTRDLAQAGSGKQDTLIKMDQEGLRTQRSVYFDLNSAEIRVEFDPALQAHARYLAANPKSRIRIEGNADERGAPDYNARLGMKRAESVRQTMIRHGAPEQQVKVKTLGESRPKLKGHDEESWAENRRADVVYEVEK